MAVLVRVLKLFVVILAVVTTIVIVRTLTLKPGSLDLAECKPSDSDFIKADNDLIGRFQQALQFRTVSRAIENYDTEQLLAIQTFIIKTYKTIHSSPLVTFEVVSNYSLLYHVAGSDKSLTPYLLMGHLDVVPADDGDRWDAPPFSGKIVGEHIYGRGAIDNKQTVFGILEAVEFALKRGFKPKRSFYMAFGHDEEVLGYSGAAQLASTLKDRNVSFAFVLDEGLPLLTGVLPVGGTHGAASIARLLRERSVTLQFILDEGMAVLNGIIKGLEVPAGLVGCSEKGFINLRLSVNTTGGHSSMPEGESSIGILAAAVSRLENQPQPSMLGTGPEIAMLEHLAHKMSLGLRVVVSNIWLFKPLINYFLSQKGATNAIIRTTTAVTEFHAGIKDNVISPWAWATVNHRVHPGQTIQEVIDYDRVIINDERVKIEVVKFVDPHPISPYGDVTFGYQTIKTSIKQIWGYSNVLVAPGLMIANTDTRHYLKLSKQVYRFSPTFMFPDDVPRFHGFNERIPVKNYGEAVNFFYHLIRNADVEKLPDAHEHASEL